VREGRASGTVTVLFTDLVGSTELMSRLGAEAFDTVRQTHFAALRQAIDRHGGEEIKNTGDGLMVTFGSVVAALRGAAAMQRATDRQARIGPAPISIRVGLSIGEVTFEDGDVFGAPVVEAARLVATAGPGKILTTAIARTLAGGRTDAEFVDLGPMELKGLPDPVPVCEVLWPPVEASVPLPALLTDVGRVFVGRGGEVERLERLWKEAGAGALRVALVAGEPGVGKTRLAAELAVAAHSEGGLVLAGRCDEDLGVPYQPFVEALRHFVDHAPADDLGAQLGRYGGELARLMPELPGRVPGMSELLRSDPETERYRLFDAVAAWLAAASTNQPLLLMLDDLQWAAKPTLLLLRHVVRSSEGMHVLVVGTYRDTELASDHPLVEVLADLRRQEGVERLSLSGLDQSGVAAFMEQAAGHELEDDDRLLARAIHQETEGNPFFVREVLRHLTETGAVQRREGRWATRLPVEDLGIPEGVREVVGRRLARLSERANRMLRVAAVVGVEFDLSVLQAAVKGLSDEELVCALEEATEARLLIEAAPTRYRFGHALVRDTLYDALSAARRATLHRHIAEALERLYGAAPGPRIGELARHWMAAGPPVDVATVLHYAHGAGETALAGLAPEDAVRWFSQALELADQHSESDPYVRADLLIGLGEGQLLAGDPSHRQTLLEAAHQATRMGDTDRLVRAALANNRGTHSRTGEVDSERVAALETALAATTGDSPERAQLFATLAVELTFGGDWPRRRSLADEGLSMARRLGEPTTFVRVVNLAYLAIAVPETLEERLADTAEAVAVAEGLADPGIRHFTARFRLYACADAGDLPGIDTNLAVLEEATTPGEPSRIWVTTFIRAWRALLAGAVDEAETLATTALEIGLATGQPEAEPIYAGGLLEIRRHQGRLAEVEQLLAKTVQENSGLPMLRAKLAGLYCELGKNQEASVLLSADMVDGLARFPRDVAWLHAMASYAEVCAHLGDLTAAPLLYQRLAPWHDQMTFIYYGTGGAVALYLGMLSVALNQWDQAQGHLAEAMQIHEGLHAPYWVARTRLEWARMLLARRQPGDTDGARELLAQALDTARQLGFADVERRAVQLLS
jgi:class 3 adenylate cyclase